MKKVKHVSWSQLSDLQKEEITPTVASILRVEEEQVALEMEKEINSSYIEIYTDEWGSLVAE